MIRITLASKEEGYTREELKKLFNRYSTLNDDLDEFLAAVIRDNQLEKRGDTYFPTGVPTTDIQLEKATRRIYNADRYGGVVVTKKGSYPRIAVAAREGDERPDPTSMTLISYQTKRGDWRPIKERPILIGPGKKPSKPRKGELWRASVPAPIIKQYRLRPGTPLRVSIERIIPRYFSTLTLWGFEATAIISWVSTSTKNKKARQLELEGQHFQFEIKKSLRKEMQKAGEKLIRVMRQWLDRFDKGYSDLTLDPGTKETEQGPHTGSDFATTLYEPPRPTMATITFTDLETGREYARGEMYPKRTWADEDDEKVIANFFLGDHLKKDIVVHGKKSHPVSSRRPPERETKPEKIKRQFKQSTFNFDNKPFKGKK